MDVVDNKKPKTESANRIAEAAESPPDPFDLDALRAPPDFQQTGGVKKTTLNIRAGSRPPKDKFIRVHPFDTERGEWCLNVLAFPHQAEGEIGAENFVVPATSEVYEALFDRLRSVLIVCGVTRAGAKFLWELSLPSPNNNRRANQWHETRLTCARKAVETWIRLEADLDSGGYNYAEPLANLPEPDWGTDSFRTLIEIAYRDRIVMSLDHPVVKEYQGA